MGPKFQILSRTDRSENFGYAEVRRALRSATCSSSVHSIHSEEKSMKHQIRNCKSPKPGSCSAAQHNGPEVNTGCGS